MENKVKIYITRKKIKNMYLRVKEPDGRVEVSAPYNMKEEDIRRFIKAHEEWIQNAVLRIEEKNKNLKEAPVMAPFMEREMRQKLKKQIESLIKKWEPVMNVSSSGFTIKKMKTRWGSCNVMSHHLNFNLALAKAPEECVEYVVVHELLICLNQAIMKDSGHLWRNICRKQKHCANNFVTPKLKM